MSEPEYPVYESSEVNAREVIALLRRRRWTLLGTFAFFILGAAIITPRMTPIYRASATMLVEQTPIRVKSDIGGLVGDMDVPTQPHTLETQVEVLQSGPLRKQVIERVKP